MAHESPDRPRGAGGYTAERFQRIRRLTEVSRALTYTTSLDEVLRLTVDRAAELMDGDRAVLMLVDKDGMMEVRAARGVEPEQVRRFREPLDETLVRRLRGLLGDELAEEGFLAVPLVARGEITGLLAVLQHQPDRQESIDEWVLSALADQAAVALETARLTTRTREELEQERRAMAGKEQIRERALSNLAHDVRAPIASVQSYATLLIEGVYGPLTDRQREIVRRIHLSGHHMLSIADSMVEMARVAAGVVPIVIRDVDATTVAQESAELLLPKARSKNQQLDMAFVPRQPRLWVRADPDRLRQVLVNLVDNAIKFTPHGGSIRLDTGTRHRAQRHEGVVDVSDTGPGIPPNEIEAVFQPYHRTGATQGLGLGLAIARGLVQQMDGEVTVQSEVGRGSTFTIWLPLGRPAS